MFHVIYLLVIDVDFIVILSTNLHDRATVSETKWSLRSHQPNNWFIVTILLTKTMMTVQNQLLFNWFSSSRFVMKYDLLNVPKLYHLYQLYNYYALHIANCTKIVLRKFITATIWVVWQKMSIVKLHVWPWEITSHPSRIITLAWLGR